MYKGLKSEIESLLDHDLTENNPEFEELKKKISECKYHIKDFNLSARIIHHWKEMDLLFISGDTGGWNKFNFYDATWIKLIIKLREFNIPIPTIQEIKKQFLHHPMEGCSKEEFEFIKKEISNKFKDDKESNELLSIMLSDNFYDTFTSYSINHFISVLNEIVALKFRIRLLIDEHGNTIIEKEHRIDELYEQSEEYREIISGHHLSINLNRIVAEIITDIGETEARKMHILTEAEEQVINAMRTENVDNIEVKFEKNSGKPELLKIASNKPIEKATRIAEVILDQGYQDITIKTQNGNIVYCVNTVKTKMLNSTGKTD